MSMISKFGSTANPLGQKPHQGFAVVQVPNKGHVSAQPRIAHEHGERFRAVQRLQRPPLMHFHLRKYQISHKRYLIKCMFLKVWS